MKRTDKEAEKAFKIWETDWGEGDNQKLQEKIYRQTQELRKIRENMFPDFHIWKGYLLGSFTRCVDDPLKEAYKKGVGFNELAGLCTRFAYENYLAGDIPAEKKEWKDGLHKTSIKARKASDALGELLACLRTGGEIPEYGPRKQGEIPKYIKGAECPGSALSIVTGKIISDLESQDVLGELQKTDYDAHHFFSNMVDIMARRLHHLEAILEGKVFFMEKNSNHRPPKKIEDDFVVEIAKLFKKRTTHFHDKITSKFYSYTFHKEILLKSYTEKRRNLLNS